MKLERVPKISLKYGAWHSLKINMGHSLNGMGSMSQGRESFKYKTTQRLKNFTAQFKHSTHHQTIVWFINTMQSHSMVYCACTCILFQNRISIYVCIPLLLKMKTERLFLNSMNKLGTEYPNIFPVSKIMRRHVLAHHVLYLR